MNEESTLTLESIEEFRRSLEGRGLSALTLQAYSTDLRIFLGDLSLKSLPLAELEYRAALWLNQTRREAKPKTTQRRITSLRAYAKWAGCSVLEEYKAPVASKPTPHPLSGGMADVERLVEATKDVHHRALLALLGFCGLRVSEARSIKARHIDIYRTILVVRGKGDRERKIPLSMNALLVLFPIVIASSEDDLLVPISDTAARAFVRSVGRRVLGRSIASHDLRATLLTAINDKYGLRAAQEIAGHASSATTEVYTAVTMDRLREAVEL